MNKKGTKKMILYKKGGKLYYKKGGKMCLYKGGGPVRYRNGDTLPKHQGKDSYVLPKGPIFTNDPKRHNDVFPEQYTEDGVLQYTDQQLLNEIEQRKNIIYNPSVYRRLSEEYNNERRHETPLRFTQETPSNDIIMKKKLLDEQRKRYINSLIPARDSSKRVNLPRIIGSDSDQKMINYKAGGNLPKYQGDLYSTSEIQPITTTQVSNPYTKNVLDATVASVEAPKQKTKNNMGQVAGYAQLAAGVLDKYIPKTERDYGGSEEHYQAMKLAQRWTLLQQLQLLTLLVTLQHKTLPFR